MRKLSVLAFITLLVGCSSLGLSTPKGFDQSLAEAYGTHTAVASAAAVAVSTGALTSAEGASIQAQVLSSRQLLDAAKSVEVNNPTGAQNDLNLALTALTALQTYLNAQGKH